MIIRRLLLLLVISLSASHPADAQTGTNEANFMSLSGNATAANKNANSGINLFTGVPTISIPLYSYSHQSGLSIAISADYAGGGLKVNESPSSLGLGWNLSVGGVITRTVRGMPDEYPGKGFLFSPALPLDYRADGNKYYYDSLDAEQDLFQFNFNGRSGKFLIGKNNEIVQIPVSRMDVGYTSNPSVPTAIAAFTITTEDGVKYVFSELEQSQSYVTSGGQFQFGYANFYHPQAWYLSKIIAPFSTDSIRLFYSSINGQKGFKYPEVVHVNSNSAVSARFNPEGETSYNSQRKISFIALPDKKFISFLYDPYLKFDEVDSVLNKIQFSDSVFRYGYIFDRQGIYYDTITENGKKYLSSPIDKRSFLSGIKYYTQFATMPGYVFSYRQPFFNKVVSVGDTIGNKRDHWGFYKSTILNAAEKIPTVPGIYTGTDRAPSGIFDVLASSLISITEPAGAITYYDFEPNSIYPFDQSPQVISIDASSNTQTNITLNQVVSNLYDFKIAFYTSVSRKGAPPFSGTANLTCEITSPDGLTTYASRTMSLYKAFYVGSVIFSASIPNGNYVFKTAISSGTSAPLSLPIRITWQNEITGTGTGNITGGARIRQISKYRQDWDGIPENKITYKYLTVDGKSSGFLGLPPIYHSPISKISTTNGSNPITSSETSISSEPVNNLSYTQGSPFAYSRVEVIEENYTPDFTGILRNGKTVYEFTDLKDAESNVAAAQFPYVSDIEKEWAFGLPKKVLVYDSSGRLIKSSTNNYRYINSTYENSNFESLKLGMTEYNSNYNTTTGATSATSKFFSGQLYYPQSGRADLISTIDSFFYSDNSIQVTKNDIIYDSNFNVSKTISSYDRTRGLMLEKRNYYPYSYNLSGTIGKLRAHKIFIPVSTEQWITGDGNPRLISANVVEFQELAKGYIRPLNLHSLVSRAPVPESIIGPFNPSLLVRNNSYFKNSTQFTTYDSTGQVLEAKDVSTNESNVVLYDYFDQYPVAKVSNATIGDVAFTSFESDSKGNWTIPNYVKDQTSAVTGKYCYNMSSGSITKSGLQSNQTYIITYWTMNGTPFSIVGASTPLLLTEQNGWHLYSQIVTGTSFISINGSGLIDELRLYPRDANMITTTFEPFLGATSVCDANNTILYNEYDDLNKLVVVRDKNKNILKKVEYSNKIAISLAPDWALNGESGCQSALNGKTYHGETDVNIYSHTYNKKRIVNDTTINSECYPPCTQPNQKVINGFCETGATIYTSSVYTKICDAGESQCYWKWRCTYHYLWSDGSTSQNYQHLSDVACYTTLEP